MNIGGTIIGNSEIRLLILLGGLIDNKYNNLYYMISDQIRHNNSK